MQELGKYKCQYEHIIQMKETKGAGSKPRKGGRRKLTNHFTITSLWYFWINRNTEWIRHSTHLPD